jgi:exopolysaccharide biosynthesis polyprenyl glycosylphosphotransferase
MLLVAALRRDRRHDLQVVGACLVDPAVEPPLPALPVCGGIDDVCTVAIALGCDAVVVTPAAELDGAWLRRLGWSLHDAGIDLLLAPSLADVALTRIALTSAAGRPLLKVRAPVLTGPQRGVKSVFDLVAAALLVVLLAPVLVAIAVAVRLTSPGPALYRHRRVGRGGAEFTCLKFRTMDVDADIRRRELDHLNERREGPLFKIRHDPRITPLGAWLRRYSLDELPQLINVLGGSMSLVGPRPPLPAEASGYDDDVRRRLLVKPGLTGLWQVSGRAEIPWPEAVRLDLSYVDNWSPRLDARILLRTAGAVVRGTGAY